MAPKKERVAEAEEDRFGDQPHVFTEYACDCGASWPKEQGKVCPGCGLKQP